MQSAFLRSATSLVEWVTRAVHRQSQRNAWEAVCENEMNNIDAGWQELEAVLRRR